MNEQTSASDIPQMVKKLSGEMTVENSAALNEMVQKYSDEIKAELKLKIEQSYGSSPIAPREFYRRLAELVRLLASKSNDLTQEEKKEAEALFKDAEALFKI